MKRIAAIAFSLGIGFGAATPLQAGPATLDGPAAGAAAGEVRLAQLRLEFGVSDATVLRSLRRDGYTEIEIFYRGMTKARVRACKNGVRYQMEVSPNGRIKAAGKIGNCRVRITLGEARDILRKRGYREINLEQTPDGAYRGAACRGRDRLRMSVGAFGEVRELQPLGQCRRLLTRPEVAARLRSRGYNRIDFADRPPPPFVAKACRKLDRVRLVIVGNGRIQREERIGDCAPPIDPRRIAQVLERKGFTRVRVTDDVLPRYGAEACRKGVRFEITLNRFGDIRDRREVGRCPTALTRQQLAEKLRAEGFKRIRFVESTASGHVVEACQGEQRLRIEFSPYGETLFDRVLGPCKSPRIGKLIDDFKERGVSGVTLYLEGCRNGRRVQVEFDRFGTALNARRLGRCP